MIDVLDKINNAVIDHLESLKIDLKIDHRDVTIIPYVVVEGMKEVYPSILVDAPVPTSYTRSTNTPIGGYFEIDFPIHCVDKTTTSAEDEKKSEIRVGNLAMAASIVLHSLHLPYLSSHEITFEEPQEFGNKIKNITLVLKIKVLVTDCN